MQAAPHICRRRMLQVTAAACGALLLPAGARTEARHLKPVTWRGVALGAPAEIKLYAESEAAARPVLQRTVTEIRRLEAVFSLYIASSALSRLNRDGELRHPPLDLVRLASTAKGISAATGGAFDPTIQPLWTLYAAHFARNPHARAGPDSSALAHAVSRVDCRAVTVAENLIAFDQEGMALSLNGIAQGYITDRVADILRGDGFEHVLVNLGEIRALGSHPAGRPWNVAIDTGDHGSHERTLTLSGRAVATSAPHATPIGAAGRAHHLFDPRDGSCAYFHKSITVTADTATLADAYSTAFAVMPWEKVKRLADARSDLHVHALDTHGTWHTAGRG